LEVEHKNQTNILKENYEDQIKKLEEKIKISSQKPSLQRPLQLPKSQVLQQNISTTVTPQKVSTRPQGPINSTNITSQPKSLQKPQETSVNQKISLNP